MNMQTPFNFRISVVACLLVIIGAMLFFTPAANCESKQILKVTRVKSTPSAVDDPIWAETNAMIVPFEGKEKFADKKASVTTRAAYTDDHIYFLFKWKDPTLSVTKGAWQYDGQKWDHQGGNEDRISLLFEINRINKFATKGCAVVCHIPEGETNAKNGKFGTKSAAEKGDLWHWKAARSDPAGYADDTYVTQISADAGGRKSDAGKGGDTKNMTEDKSKPRFTAAPGKMAGKNGVLLAAHTVEITDYDAFKTGDTLTYRMPNTHAGSRADIKADSRYADGGWTVMLARRLDTGNDDDVAFNPRKKYNFAMALFDDSGDENSYDSEVLTLQFER
jgi:hypothetical protein